MLSSETQYGYTPHHSLHPVCLSVCLSVHYTDPGKIRWVLQLTGLTMLLTMAVSWRQEALPVPSPWQLCFSLDLSMVRHLISHMGFRTFFPSSLSCEAGMCLGSKAFLWRALSGYH